MSDRINKIIDETEQLLKTISRFQKEAIYVENRGKNIIEIKTGESLVKKEVVREVEKKAVTEVDLFGNITIKKEDWEFSESLDEMDKMICECQKCRLGEGRNKFVFGVGDPNSDIVFIGEAPGADEDAQGEPFVGRAGQLLNKIIESIGFKREEVYICNIIKCRPPGNRNPLPDEVEQCRPYLEHQLNLVKPKLIMLLGRVAAESLLKTKEPLNKLRGKIHNYKSYKVMITFHPAALLRNPHWKRPTWDDMKQFKKLYDELIADKK